MSTRAPIHPAVVGLGVALLAGLIGWAIVDKPGPSNSQAVPATRDDTTLEVVPASDQGSASAESGRILQQAPNQSTGGSPGSELQSPGSTDHQAPSGTELFRQSEHGDLTVEVAR